MQTRPETTNVGDCLDAAAQNLRDAGIDDARREARLLLAHVLETPVENLFAYPEQSVRPGDAEKFFAFVTRRSDQEPLSRITGSREFWSLSFDLSPATLDPRADSETIIDAVLAARPDRTQAYRLLDLGTGSGCLIGALLSEYPGAMAVAVDASADAVETAAANLARLGFADRATCRLSGWDDQVDGRFDIIVSNPPYIVDADIAGLAEGVKAHDPHLALAGGVDGLAAYRALAPVLARRLAGDGLAVLEHGDGQHDDVTNIFAQAGLNVLGNRADLAGHVRCIILSAG